jgi:DUF4097 and DUF4098 domain-containing protein YvlB
MRARRSVLLAALAVVALPAVASEARYYREGRYLVHEIVGAIPASSPRIRVDTDLGSVRVRAAQRDEVRYRIRVRAAAGGSAAARRLLDNLLISVGRSGDLILFTGQTAAPQSLRGLMAEFEIDVPVDAADIETYTGGGDVDARGTTGRATLVTRAGNIFALSLGGPLRAETRSGTIRVGRVESDARMITGGGSVHLEEAGGDVLVRSSGGNIVIGRTGGRVEIESGGGDVRIEDASSDVTVETGGGNITLGNVGGHVQAATLGGGIRIGSAARGVRCETGAGAIEFHADGGPLQAITSIGNIMADLSSIRGAFAGSDLQTRQGDVVVSIPESLALNIRALLDNPAAGRIRSDFPLSFSRRVEGIGRPITIAEGEIAGGGSLLTLRSLGGDIVIIKAKQAGQ